MQLLIGDVGLDLEIDSSSLVPLANPSVVVEQLDTTTTIVSPHSSIAGELQGRRIACCLRTAADIP